jgi:hypothetical protein
MLKICSGELGLRRCCCQFGTLLLTGFLLVSCASTEKLPSDEPFRFDHGRDGEMSKEGSLSAPVSVTPHATPSPAATPLLK